MHKCKIINEYIIKIRTEYEYYFANVTLLYPNSQYSTFFNRNSKVIILLKFFAAFYVNKMDPKPS